MSLEDFEANRLTREVMHLVLLKNSDWVVENDDLYRNWINSFSSYLRMRTTGWHNSALKWDAKMRQALFTELGIKTLKEYEVLKIMEK